MEIHKQNLVAFSLQQDRLQNNFIVIENALKALQEQMGVMQKQHQSIITNMKHREHQIENLFGVTTKHTSQIHAQKLFTDQLNSQLNSFDKIDVEEKIQLKTSDKENDFQNFQEKSEKSLTKGVALQKIQKKEVSLPLPLQKEGKKVNEGRNLFQKALSNIKERLIVLEKDSQQKDKILSELNTYIKPKKNRESELQQQKRSKDVALKPISSSKKDIRPLPQLQECKEYDDERIDSSRVLKRRTDIFEEIDSETILPNPQDYTFKLEGILAKQVQKMKVLLQQKTRVLDLHLKQNQGKIQNIQKNIDILERSHDLLKYDFERSSTSCSKNRSNNETQELKHRPNGDQRLNDTKITQKEYYEEKLVSLFNQMELLKGEYLDIHSIIEKEDNEIPVQGNGGNLQNFKSKIAKRLVQSKDEGEQKTKKELQNCRRDLKKLRQQFDEFANGVNLGSHEVKTYVIKPNQNKEDWKSLSTKIYKLKMELQAGVRELEGKIVTSNDMVVVINQLEVGIQECKLLIKKKVQSSDFQKAIKRVQGRLNNFILQVFQKENQGNGADATITKQPWFCLSCDSELKNYSGKLQKSSSPAQRLMGRKVNPELHMVRHNDNSRLPSVIK